MSDISPIKEFTQYLLYNIRMRTNFLTNRAQTYICRIRNNNYISNGDYRVVHQHINTFQIESFCLLTIHMTNLFEVLMSTKYLPIYGSIIFERMMADLVQMEHRLKFIDWEEKWSLIGASIILDFMKTLHDILYIVRPRIKRLIAQRREDFRATTQQHTPPRYPFPPRFPFPPPTATRIPPAATSTPPPPPPPPGTPNDYTFMSDDGGVL